ncbi:exodeoxyribonuclease V subunit gamma [Conservatibacter flavescens]|uniref:RecBCD enzyme subunit RecC n=1 Tax=Conservatibacter flavescens TaxID=28161 RepID=A0A2M8S0H2_9PAST|nr:exodeoxyribonuclease V subunit gamma [Conservatibacter flavescens]PJG84606.1 exodeoxyribonuclease V subunit gamma [Conservatibacter flavescens]
MFTIYHANQLDTQKEMLLKLMEVDPLADPFASEIILVQSPGMAQWLQIQMAERLGIAANLHFPMPASFIWQQYCATLPNVTEQTLFNKEAMTWRLMNLIQKSQFQPLLQYFQISPQSAQHKLYQLVYKIADLFDQYLVYRPDWINAWEQQNDDKILQEILGQQQDQSQVVEHIQWQGHLWRALVAEIKASQGEVLHRANLHQRYLQALQQNAPTSLPPRIFIFGISALPKSYLDTFYAISQHCDVHLFFNNPSRYYWGDILDPLHWQQLNLRQRQDHISQQNIALLSEQQHIQFSQQDFAITYDNEQLLVGNPLLATWGKLGRDFLHMLTDLGANEISAYFDTPNESLLQQIQQSILELQTVPLHVTKEDPSLSIHACHSAMREVEVLHDHLLQLFETDPNLTPKDIVVMTADIDHYTPYIHAVFGQYQDNRAIPYSLSDGKLTANDVLVSGFLNLFSLPEKEFNAEDVLALLDIPAVRERFQIEATEFTRLRAWVEASGIRFGLTPEDIIQPNYNAWQSGLERMLLGYAMREENGIWQDCIGFDSSYGLKGPLVGKLSAFIEVLSQWQHYLSQDHSIKDWQFGLIEFMARFFQETADNQDTLLYLKKTINELAVQLEHIGYEDLISTQVLSEVLTEKWQHSHNELRFLAGKVSFCTLLPMRAIPFKVVCLLGMNDGDYPRQQPRNSFDLMQYHRQKGDRLRREDDRYLFLEALLSAQQQLYISYIGRSIVDNQAKEPSVLVNQLIDYICENATETITRSDVIQQHSMQIFSPENFGKAHRSFAYQWLPSADNKDGIPDFIQPLVMDNVTGEKPRIELSALIQFVQNPVKHFFEKRLGVYFKQDENHIESHENFVLDHLSLYQIRDALLRSPENLTAYFEALKIKGTLPLGAFGQIYAQKVRSDLKDISALLAPYFDQVEQQKSIELELDSAVLYGNISQLYGAEYQRVGWRVGSIRDSDRIENWLVYLALQGSTEQRIPPAIFYGKNKKWAGESTKIVEKATALSQLNIYVEAYLRGEYKLQLIPSPKMGEYFKLLNKEENEINMAQYRAIFERIAYEENYTFVSEDLYWQRVLSQSRQIDFDEVNGEFLRWFGLLLSD